MAVRRMPAHRSATRSRGRGERGTAAVEAGLIMSLLSPMLVGVLFYGNYFWQAQRLSAYAPHVTQSSLVGLYGSCQDLLTAVRNTVLVDVNNASGSTRVTLDDVTAQVVDYLPDTLGVDVRVSVRVPVVASSVDALLPNHGDVVSEALTRLENVRLSVQGC